LPVALIPAQQFEHWRALLRHAQGVGATQPFRSCTESAEEPI
jgi:hypothetical protein